MTDRDIYPAQGICSAGREVGRVQIPRRSTRFGSSVGFRGSDLFDASGLDFEGLAVFSTSPPASVSQSSPLHASNSDCITAVPDITQPYSSGCRAVLPLFFSTLRPPPTVKHPCQAFVFRGWYGVAVGQDAGRPGMSSYKGT